jgi:hypothetical protein
MTLSGSCHCGRVRFEVDVDTFEALDCNCSVCTKKGFLHLIVPKERFRLLSGADALTTYTFNTHVAKHHFCATCGIHAYYVPRSHPDQIDVNVRALDDEQARARFVTTPFDGKNWEANVDTIR